MNNHIDPQVLLSRECIADPYPIYDQLRPRSPVCYMWPQHAGITMEGDASFRPVFGLLKFEQLVTALRDYETFSSATNRFMQEMPLVLLTDDPPRHQRFRRIVNKAFTNAHITAQRPWIASYCESLFNRLPAGEIEFMEQLAIPLPVRVIAGLMGIPESDYALFKRWSDSSSFAIHMSAQERERNRQDMINYFKALAKQRRAAPLDDLVSTIVQAEEGALEEWEVVGFLSLLLVSGNETTTYLLGNMLHILADRPEIWEAVQADRSLVSAVVEETLRFESPVQRLFRVTTREVQMGDVVLPADQLLQLYFGAANRDPEAWPEPDVFRLDRKSPVHLAFGRGIHLCLGGSLARLEAEIMLNTLLDRYSGIALTGSPAVRQNLTPLLLGYQSLPLRLVASPRRKAPNHAISDSNNA